MTLLFQSMATASKSASTSTSKSGSTSEIISGVTSDNSIDGSMNTLLQSFSQLMGEGTAPKTVLSFSDVASLLEGLLQNATVNENTSAEPDLLNQLLQGLNDEITKVDEMIEVDPSLMVTLQGWLQQVNILLSAKETETETEIQTETETETEKVELDQSTPQPNVLAEHPETIRFAVQDALSQLVSMLRNNDVASHSNSQAVQLLASVQKLLNQAEVDKPLISTDPVEVKETAKVSELVQSNLSKFTQSEGSTVLNRTEMVGKSNDSQVSTSVKVDQLIRILQGSTTIQSENVITSPKLENTAKETVELTPDQGILTAGELMMREGIKHPIKATTVPLPVEQFAKEMTNFVVSKLDFVKLNGMTEAKISLYPEHLGQVDIKITMQNGQLVATFMTEHAGAKGLLEQQMSQLRASLQIQGIQVEKLEVTQNQSLESHMNQEGRQPSSDQQQFNSRSKGREGQSEDSIEVAKLAEEMNDWLSGQVNTVQGNTFTAKA
jgi:flagellar hook-length control protein FliK